MSENLKNKWNELFGVGWDRIMDICPEIGGFLIDHKNRVVEMDKNSIRLTETDEVPDYDSMIGFLDILSQDSTTFSRLAPQVFYSDKNYTAGILRWHYDFSGARAKDVVPMCERPQLVSYVRRAEDDSLLVLIEFAFSDKSEIAEYHLFGVLAAVIREFPEGSVFSPNYKNCFWLFCPHFSGDPVAFLKDVQKFVNESGQGDGMGGSKINGRYITFTAGIGASAGNATQRMSAAEFALYQANNQGESSIVSYSSEQYEQNKGEYEQMSRFLRLVNENLFIYYFQPIVSAKNGEIVAYEMLMRSDSSIGMMPLEILDCAEKAKKLYDIEKATIYNALSIIEKHQDIFKKKKLFVNAISAYMLNDNDWNALVNRYGELMEKMVIELTEQTELSNEIIDTIRMRLGHSNIRIAIDDFGTGYSNTSNLIRYSPDYVKIDRSLISGINLKPTVKKLVSGFIEFIHENGYVALAEGVETYEELQTMIQLGADLIQGFYISKPKPTMLFEVSDNACRDIETINLIHFGSISRPYHPDEDETVDFGLIKSDGYSSVFVETKKVAFKGRADSQMDTVIMLKSGIKTTVTLENVSVKTEKESPTFLVGENSEVELILKGDNLFDGRGIYVPMSSTLKITGTGNLEVIANNEDCYAIGADSLSSCGNIIIDMAQDSKLTITANGDRAVGIGAGKNDNSTVIRLIGGNVSVTCSGGSCIGIGIRDGGAIVDVESSSCSVNLTSPDSVGVGSFKGATDISMKNFDMRQCLNGISTAGIGSNEAGSGRIMLMNGILDFTVKGRLVNCIGTRSGSLYCHVVKSFVDFYCEGGSVSGIGDMYGSGDVTLEEDHLNFDMRTGDGFAFGSRSGTCKSINTEEKIKINA